MSENNMSAELEGYANGQIIFSEFEKGNRFYLIKSGKVELIKIDGKVRKTLDILGPSEMFGEMALLEDSPRFASAIAVGDVQLMVFNSANFKHLMLNNPPITIRLLKMFAKRIYEAKRRISILTIKNFNARICGVILMLLDDVPVDPKDQQITTFALEVTTEEIARWAALDLITAQNAINDLVNQGIIDISKEKKLTIKNIHSLNRVVNLYNTKKPAGS
ncbi:Crp/Fnr family transcriptional regulator [Spirochaetia bacterium]|nr:Crp/Fnr family transcriptional regulator [Spirochaetia bacterium]